MYDITFQAMNLLISRYFNLSYHMHEISAMNYINKNVHHSLKGILILLVNARMYV